MSVDEILTLAKRNFRNDYRELTIGQKELSCMILDYALDLCDYIEEAIFYTARDISPNSVQDLNDLARELVRTSEVDMIRFFHHIYGESLVGLRWYLRNDYLLMSSKHCNRAACRTLKCICENPLIRDVLQPYDPPMQRETLLEVADRVDANAHIDVSIVKLR